MSFALLSVSHPDLVYPSGGFSSNILFAFVCIRIQDADDEVQTSVGASVTTRRKAETIQPSSQQGAKKTSNSLKKSQPQIPSKGSTRLLPTF